MVKMIAADSDSGWAGVKIENSNNYTIISVSSQILTSLGNDLII